MTPTQMTSTQRNGIDANADAPQSDSSENNDTARNLGGQFEGFQGVHINVPNTPTLTLQMVEQNNRDLHSMWAEVDGIREQVTGVQDQVAGVREVLDEQVAGVQDQVTGVREVLDEQVAGVRDQVAGVREVLDEQVAGVRDQVAGLKRS